MKGIILAMIVAAMLAAGRAMADARTYDDLGNVDTSDTSFWNVAGHVGVAVDEVSADAGALELRSRTEKHTSAMQVRTAKFQGLALILK